MPRPEVGPAIVEVLHARFRRHLDEQIAKKGRAALVSSHETYGAVDEEVSEFKEAVHQNDRARMRQELMDVMVAAFWGLASEAEGGWDWCPKSNLGR